MEENRSDFSKHTAVLAILGLGLILLGTVGFHQYYSTRDAVYSWVDCFYLSLQLITMNSGGVSSPVPLQLNIARFSLPMLTVYTFFSLIWFAFRDRILSFRLRRLRDHVIICGLGRKGNFLAHAYQARKCPVVLIEKDPNNEHLEAFQKNSANASVLIADACDATILRRAGLSKAKLLISTLGQDADNASVAEAAKKALERCESLDHKEHDCKIHVSDYKMWTLFHETEFDRRHDAGDGSEIFRLSFFNVRESGARYVVNQLRGQKYFNPEACREQNRIGIIDISGLGELLILHIAREWSGSETFRNQGKRIKLFIWDTDIEHKIKMIHNKYPIVKDVCEFLSFNLDIDNPFFATMTLPECFDGGAVLPMPIYVCVEDQNVCVNLSMAAMRAYRALPVRIVVLLSEDKGLLDLLNKYRGQSGMAELQAVNLLEKTCNPDVLDDGTHEALARAIHETYSVRFVKEGDRQAWEHLNKDEKEQNLDQALFIGDQLHSVGCGVTPWIEYGAESFKFTEHEVESMAMAEHERWMDKYKGWKYGPVKNKENKEHPCLVPWITLPEKERDKDRNTVRQIPMYLAKAGFQIYRMRITEV